MTQSIFIQVGQSGNQIGCRFWDLALREHAEQNRKGIYDDALSSFFRNVDTRYEGGGGDIAVGRKARTLKARAVLIDMEESVVNDVLAGPLGEVFDERQLITDVSGSGNNWAVGHEVYGVQYHDAILEQLRQAAEHCDCLQSFFMLHSMGGGTGSGVGTSVLELLEDEFPDVYRFTTCVFPSEDDDVITSPYNSVLALRRLTEHADCVLPVENQALIDICAKIETAKPKERKDKVRCESALSGSQSAPRPYDDMNNIVAHLLLNLTSSSRFSGALNVDLNEITMNLVPFPRLHYLVAAQTPLYALLDAHIPSRRLDQMFTDAFSRDHQLIKANPKGSLYLACGLFVRGQVSLSDVRRNIERLRPSLQFVHWNHQGWKTGLCAVPPIAHQHSLLTLSNNCCITDTFGALENRFMKLYRRKAHVHHYTQEMDASEFDESLESLQSIRAEYSAIARAHYDAQAQLQTPADELDLRMRLM